MNEATKQDLQELHNRINDVITTINDNQKEVLVQIARIPTPASRPCADFVRLETQFLDYKKNQEQHQDAKKSWLLIMAEWIPAIIAIGGVLYVVLKSCLACKP